MSLVLAVSIRPVFIMCLVSIETVGHTISFTQSLAVSTYEWFHILQCFYILDPQHWYLTAWKWVMENGKLRTSVFKDCFEHRSILPAMRRSLSRFISELIVARKLGVREQMAGINEVFGGCVWCHDVRLRLLPRTKAW